jgi:hypothetical protein
MAQLEKGSRDESSLERQAWSCGRENEEDILVRCQGMERRGADSARTVAGGELASLRRHSIEDIGIATPRSTSVFGTSLSEICEILAAA